MSLTVEAPIASTLEPHVTPAPVLPDVLPPVRQLVAARRLQLREVTVSSFGGTATTLGAALLPIHAVVQL